MVYTCIFHVYAVLTDNSGIYLVNTSWVCSVPFFIMIYLGYTMNISKIIYHVYTMYIPYTYYVYIIHIQMLHLSLVYTMYIPCIYILYPCMII